MKTNKNNANQLGTRTCFVCKKTADKQDLLRFVGRPGQELTFDIRRRLPGRGMWVHADTSCLKKAFENRLFYKAAKGTVRIPENLYELIQEQLKSANPLT